RQSDRRRFKVIVSNAIAVPTLMQATAVIPIVFALGLDPVGAGVVASLARPGGNVTGLSTQSTDIAGKRLELLREVLPRLRRLQIRGNLVFPNVRLESAGVQAVPRGHDIELPPLEIRRAEDIAPAFEALKGQAHALYVVVDALVNANGTRIITFSLSARLP